MAGLPYSMILSTNSSYVHSSISRSSCLGLLMMLDTQSKKILIIRWSLSLMANSITSLTSKPPHLMGWDSRATAMVDLLAYARKA